MKPEDGEPLHSLRSESIAHVYTFQFVVTFSQTDIRRAKKVYPAMNLLKLPEAAEPLNIVIPPSNNGFTREG
jgi:hypothetical protein